MNFLIYLIILALGGYIGYKDILNDFVNKRIAMMQNYALLFILFIMGISLGIDNHVIEYFATIGYQSIVIALFTIIFSILFVKLISKKVLQREERITNDN
mgnify:CR=1 FL=1